MSRQNTPSPVYPAPHRQVYDPIVSSQMAFESHGRTVLPHSYSLAHVKPSAVDPGPAYPALQAHVYEPSVLAHVAFPSHCVVKRRSVHSLTSTQDVPFGPLPEDSYPALQAHEKDPPLSVHKALGLQSLALGLLHSSTFAHVAGPTCAYPASHEHENDPSELTHEDVVGQRPSSHSFTSTHVMPSPVKPGLQVHSCSPGVFRHAACGEHGACASTHSFTSWQNMPSPRYPALHAHVNEPSVLEQLLPKMAQLLAPVVHSLLSEHVKPSAFGRYPVLHVQVKAPSVLLHAAFGPHDVWKHSLISVHTVPLPV
mmetsp:Transcript_19172/g.49820  ORF Transcript_19172/g.49820 Transcript_19172/m.49820 type:complete len:311 (-) Transcript_19172:843-1775(-)